MKSRTIPDSDTVGAKSDRRANSVGSLVRDVFRAYVTKLVLLVVIFVTVPVLVYDQFRSADDDKMALLRKSARDEGRLLAEALRPQLSEFTPRLSDELAARLSLLSGPELNVKVLFRPRESQGPDGFFFVASAPAVSTEQLETERVQLIVQGILEKVRKSCDGAVPISARYVSPSGAEEVLTSLTPLQTRIGCWVIITSRSTAEFVGSSIGQPYWMTPEIRSAAVIYTLMALFIVWLYVGGWKTLRRFERLARDIRTAGARQSFFAEFKRVPELRGFAREFDRMVEKLDGSARSIRYAAEENAHAFKTPIAVISQSVEPLKRSVSEDDQRGSRAIEMIEQSVDRLDALISAARRVDEVTAELLNPPVQRVALLPLLRRVVESYGEAYDQAGRRVVMRDSLPANVRASEELLESVMENLLDNAIGFSPPNGEVAVRLWTEDGQAIITVEDDGPGVAPENLERIFERYFSHRPVAADGNHEIASEGRESHFGIGLWVVRRNVEAVGGNVHAENRESGGLRVRVTLPLY